MGGRGGSGNRAAAAVKTPAASPAPAAAAPPAPQSLEQQILSAYYTAETHYVDPSFVTLAGIRESLPNVSRDALDAALKRLDRAGTIELVPNNDQKNVTRREREAGFSFGGKQVVMFRPTNRAAANKTLRNASRGMMPGSPGYSGGTYGYVI